MNDSLVHAWNVTDRYIELYQKQLGAQALAEDELLVKIVLIKEGSSGSESSDRIHAKLTAERNGQQVDFGFTPSPTDDLNKYLIFRLKINQTYTLSAWSDDGLILKTWPLNTDDGSSTEVRLEI